MSTRERQLQTRASLGYQGGGVVVRLAVGIPKAGRQMTRVRQLGSADKGPPTGVQRGRRQSLAGQRGRSSHGPSRTPGIPPALGQSHALDRTDYPRKSPVDEPRHSARSVGGLNDQQEKSCWQRQRSLGQPHGTRFDSGHCPSTKLHLSATARQRDELHTRINQPNDEPDGRTINSGAMPGRRACKKRARFNSGGYPARAKAWARDRAVSAPSRLAYLIPVLLTFLWRPSFSPSCLAPT